MRLKNAIVVVALLAAAGLGAAGTRMLGARVPVVANRLATVQHRIVANDLVRADLYLPTAPASWLVFVHEEGWPAPDEKERAGAALADALQQRGIAVAVVSFRAEAGAPLERVGDAVAAAIRAVAGLGGLASAPVLAGEEAGATLVAALALDPHYGFATASLRGVIVFNGVFDEDANAKNNPLTYARADAPPFLLLSAHDEVPRAAQSSRRFARALERSGAKDVRTYHASSRDARSLGNLSGEGNDVGDLVAAFVTGQKPPAGSETAVALAETWGRRAPLSSEGFWNDERLIVHRPTDSRLRARLRNVYGEMIRDLEPWPLAAYASIDVGDYLRAHPELGTGDWIAITNARGEKLVLPRSEIEQKKPVLVVGIDDERNLFRLFVTYNVRRTYSWKPELEVRPLLVRSVGAFLHVPGETDVASPDGTLHPLTGAEFALTPGSFQVLEKDPLATARTNTKPLAAALTDEQGCLQCHALRGEGARAHHVRAGDGRLAEGFGLALEEYPRDVLRRFLFDQQEVAKSFGVGPLELPAATLEPLFALITR